MENQQHQHQVLQQKPQETEQEEGLSMAPPPFQLMSSAAAPPPSNRPMNDVGMEMGNSEATSTTVAPVQRALDPELDGEARTRFRIPERHGRVGGWNDRRPRDGGRRRMDLNTRAIARLMERIDDPEIQRHIQETIDWFVNDTDETSHLDRDEIDLPLVLAIAIRESGRFDFLTTSEDRVVTGGRSDTHRDGVGGLDNAGAHVDHFPTAIRDEVMDVHDDPRLRSRLRAPSRHPAYLPGRDMLAAYIVEVHRYEGIFESRLHGRIGLGNLLTEEQIDQLEAAMTRDARRAWIQSAFGSHNHTQFNILRGLIRAKMSHSTAEDPFADVLADDQCNLNAIVTNDAMMATHSEVFERHEAEDGTVTRESTGEFSDLSGHRTQISAAEAWMIEQALPTELLHYREGETGPPETDASSPTEETAPTAETASPAESPASTTEPPVLRKVGSPMGGGGRGGSFSETLGVFNQTMGEDFSGVKIHTNSSQATQLKALAYTQGEEVHFAPGQFNPQSDQGMALIGHELAHVKQQRHQNVQANTQVGGFGVNNDSGLEAEADAMGAKAVQTARSQPFQLKSESVAAPVSQPSSFGQTYQGDTITQRKAAPFQLKAVVQRQVEGEEESASTTETETVGPTPDVDHSAAGPYCDPTTHTLTPALLSRIYRAGGSGEDTDAYTSRMIPQAISEAFCEAEEMVATDDATRAAHTSPGRARDRYQPVHWSADTSVIGSHISPLDTGEATPTLRDAFAQHREAELSRIVGTPVTTEMVVAARILAQNEGMAAFAEAARRVLFMGNEYALINTLNPSQSGRYRPNGQTFCNIYVWDLCRAQGVSPAAMPGGNANQFAHFTATHPEFWHPLGGPDAAQARANEGHIVIITAVGTRFAGHVSLIPPENTALGAGAHRDEEGHVDSPLESNAGGGSDMTEEDGEVRPNANFRYENRHDLYGRYPDVYGSRGSGPRGGTSRPVQWWNHGHTEAGFYEYVGPIDTSGDSEAVASSEIMGIDTTPTAE